jgi:hypothetical protein
VIFHLVEASPQRNSVADLRLDRRIVANSIVSGASGLARGGGAIPRPANNQVGSPFRDRGTEGSNQTVFLEIEFRTRDEARLFERDFD